MSTCCAGSPPQAASQPSLWNPKEKHVPVSNPWFPFLLTLNILLLLFHLLYICALCIKMKFLPPEKSPQTFLHCHLRAKHLQRPILGSPETHVSNSLLNTRKRGMSFPHLRKWTGSTRGQHSPSTAHRASTWHLLHPPDRPPSPDLFHLLEHQTETQEDPKGSSQGRPFPQSLLRFSSPLKNLDNSMWWTSPELFYR